jgi:hypothetical protein
MFSIRLVRGLIPSLLVISSFLLMAAATPGKGNKTKKPLRSASIAKKNSTIDYSASSFEFARCLYKTGEFSKYGLSQKAFEYAWKGYQYLLKKGKVQRSDILSICDFSQSSRNKRLYIIDINDPKVLINTYVAHGRNSGKEYACSFSNAPESHKSSLGFYITRTTYYGDHGISLKIDGVEKGINDRASSRHIVIHGSDYLGELFMQNNLFNGRSFGCPAVPADEIEEVITTIKEGSCLFIYHPSRAYLKKSKILG